MTSEDKKQYNYIVDLSTEITTYGEKIKKYMIIMIMNINLYMNIQMVNGMVMMV